jgi:hypothetical protein
MTDERISGSDKNIGGVCRVDQVHVGLQHAVQIATMLLENFLERFKAVTGLCLHKRGTCFAKALIDSDRVTGFVDRID